MIKITSDNSKINIDWVEFSDGALTCTIDNAIMNTEKFICLYVHTSTPCKQILEEISLVKDALSEMLFNWNNVETILYMPYLPYARADRVFVKGNPNGLDNFLNRLSGFRFNKIHFADVHNEKALSALNDPSENKYSTNFQVMSQLQCATSVFPPSVFFDLVVAPDKGAIQKATKIANHYNVPLLTATKVRDKATGKILSIDIDTSYVPTGSRVLIADDICDGGGTFIPIAKQLKAKQCHVSLYVTHLIAAKGLELFEDSIDTIYNFQIIGNYVNDSHVNKFNNR
jgi:ribose-phosphate pyrophosphokinase